MTTIDRIRERVGAIPEPCAIAMGQPMTIGDMGLIEDVTLADGLATVTLCLTDSACVHFQAMRRFISDVLADMPGVSSVRVVQTLDVLWTDERMTAR